MLVKKIPLYTSLFRQPAEQAKQLKFNAQKFRGHMTMATTIFENFFRVWSRLVRTVPGNMLVKFEVRIFSRIGTIGI